MHLTYLGWNVARALGGQRTRARGVEAHTGDMGSLSYPLARRAAADLADELDDDELQALREGADLVNDPAQVVDRALLVAVVEHDERIAPARHVLLLPSWRGHGPNIVEGPTFALGEQHRYERQTDRRNETGADRRNGNGAKQLGGEGTRTEFM